MGHTKILILDLDFEILELIIKDFGFAILE